LQLFVKSNLRRENLRDRRLGLFKNLAAPREEDKPREARYLQFAES